MAVSEQKYRMNFNVLLTRFLSDLENNFQRNVFCKKGFEVFLEDLHEVSNSDVPRTIALKCVFQLLKYFDLKQLSVHEHLLLGTVFAQIVQISFPTSEKTLLFLHSLLADDPVEELLIEGDRGVLSTNIEDLIDHLYCKLSFNISHISILQGILACKNKEYLLSETQTKNGIQPFVVIMQDPIYKLCKQGDRFLFQSFSLLLSSLKAIRELLHFNNLKSETLVLSFDTVATIVKSNWENQLQGFPELPLKVLCELLAVKAQEEKCQSIDASAVTTFYLQVMAMPWNLKGKFLSLECLVPHVGSLALLDAYPEVVDNIFLAFLSNHTTVASVRVYKVIVKDMILRNDTPDALLVWTKFWSDAILHNLRNTEKAISQNIVTHVLPWTIKTFPETLCVLQEMLQKEKGNKSLLSQVTLYRIARQSGLLSLENMDIEIIEMSLYHSDECVRVEALAFLCSSAAKKLEKPSTQELLILKEFLKLNLNIDCPAFRNSLCQNMRILLARIRDSLLQIVCKRKDKLSNHPECIDFVDWLWNLLTSNLFPGSSYQRRQTCLSLLLVVMETFTYQEETKLRKKGTPSERISFLVETIQLTMGKWIWFSDECCLKIIRCLWDRVTEIQDLTSELIINYCPQWKENKENNIFVKLIREGSELCCSPRSQEFNTGAQIFNIAYKKAVWEGSTKIVLHPEVFVKWNTDTAKESLALSFLENLVLWAENHFERIRSSFLEAAKETPLHGVIVSLNFCLSEKHIVSELLRTYKEKMEAVILKTMNLCKRVVEHILNTMALKTSIVGAAPSFEEIELALETFCQPGNDNSTSNVNEEVQILLSCCWINLKECSQLLSTTCEVYLSQEPVMIPVLEEFLNVFVAVLTKCRHRGAIEACYSSFSHLCKCVIRCTLIDGTSVLRSLIIQEFAQFKRSLSSLTRRSAGLPLLVQAVVASELPYSARELLVLSMETLLKMALDSKEDASLVDEMQDDPRTHSLHILKVLFNDAQISRDLLPWVERVFILCGEAFTSPMWNIRNGALQLYGSLALRLVGQKGSKSTSVSIDVLIRYPRIHSFILAQLESASNLEEKIDVGLILVPLLSLLSIMTPSQDTPDSHLGCLSKDYIPVLKPLLKRKQWTIRKLAAQVLTSFLAPAARVSFTEALLVECHNMCTNGFCFNYVHGILLTVEEVIQLQLDEPDGSRILRGLKNCKWLGTVENHCTPVRELYLEIIWQMRKWTHLQSMVDSISQELVPQTFQVSTDLLNSQEVKLIFHALPPDKMVQMGISFLSEFSSVRRSSLEAAINLLMPSIPSITNSQLLIELQSRVLKILPSSGKNNTTETLLDLLIATHLAMSENDLSYCLLLDASRSIHIVTDTCRCNFGPSVRNKSLHLWSLWIQKTSVQPNLLFQDWLEAVITSCAPNQLQDTRLYGANALLTAGQKVLTWLLDSQQESQLCRFSDCILETLQDVDPEVRITSAAFVSTLLQEDKVYFQSNKAMLMFSHWLIENLNCIQYILNYYWNKISQPLTILEKRKHCKRKMILFEQEECNPYAEPIVLVDVYKTILQELLKKNPSTTVEKWVDLKYEESVQYMEKVVVSVPCCPTDTPASTFSFPNASYLLLYKAHCRLQILECHNKWCDDKYKRFLINHLCI